MRNYLTDIEIVGAVMVYQEGEQCRWSMDWLVSNCDRVAVLLDNYNKETEDIILEYKKKYGNKIQMFYSTYPIDEDKNEGGRIKQRFNKFQEHIREELVKGIRTMHGEKPIDILIWPDSDEVFIDCFPRFLEKFWREDPYTYMMLGFVEVYDNFRTIISHKMAPHGRVFKYTPEFSCIPKRTRTIQNPYYGSRPRKIRQIVVHMCNFSKKAREKRQETTGRDMMTELNKERLAWLLPTDVRRMRPEEIAEYQPQPRGDQTTKHTPMLLKDYIKLWKT